MNGSSENFAIERKMIQCDHISLKEWENETDFRTNSMNKLSNDEAM